MSIRQNLTGFEEAERQLLRLPQDIRDKAIKRSLHRIVKQVATEAASRAPKPGKATGGIEYTPRRGKRASRPMLHESIGQAIRSYQGGGILVGVGGPKKGMASRHAHLVEKGFHHTTGGTFAGSGGKTRKSRRGDAFKGKGKRGAFIFPRPFLLYTFERMRGKITEMLVDDLKAFADKVNP